MNATHSPSQTRGMVCVEEARALMLAHVRRTAPVPVSLDDGLGRVLAASVIATRDQPPFHASAMDGYALRAADTPGLLRVIGEAAAGKAFIGDLPAGCAVRISTGAPLPEGADIVLAQEDACMRNGRLRVDRQARHRHVRRCGSDFACGEALIQSGVRLGIGEVALAAGAGFAHLSVAKRPRVAIIAGGDEVIAPGSIAGPAQIFDSASFAVAALVRAWGGAPARRALVGDCTRAVAATINAALTASDIVVIIGGASVGLHDHSRAAASLLNADILFQKIAIKPGKPTWCARMDGKLVLGLPGNAAAALICARLLLTPALQVMLGAGHDSAVATSEAICAGPLEAGGERETYLRARVRENGGRCWVDVIENQDTASLMSLTQSNALIQRAPHGAAVKPGEAAQYLCWTPPA